MFNSSTLRRFALVALLFTSPLLAQSTTATLSGTVVDPAGAAVADVRIIVLNTATALKRDAATDALGDFSVALLPPGKYTLRAIRSGFARIEIPNIALNTNDERTLVIKLKVGEVLQTIVVDGSTLGVESSGAVATDRARSGCTESSGSCDRLEVRRPSATLPAVRDLRASGSRDLALDHGRLGRCSQ